MRLVPPDFTNRAGEPSLKPPTELETPSVFEPRLDSDWDTYMWLEAYRLLEHNLGVPFTVEARFEDGGCL